MTILLTSEIQGQTQQSYDYMIEMLREPLKQADGFVMHTAHPIEGGWRIVEVWKSKDQLDRFFAKYVAPNIPPGVQPKIEVKSLHSLVTPEMG